MKYNQLGSTNLHVSEIGLGSWVFGGKNWGQASDADSEATIKEALNQGINFIDTAPIYGFGHAEEVIGKSLKAIRQQVIISTKCGLRQTAHGINHDLSEEFINQELLNSLQRLQTDYIDIYWIHWPDPNIPTGKALESLQKLKKKGLIRYIGLCNHALPDIQDANISSQIDCLQHQYSILERTIEKEIIPYVQACSLGLVTYGALHGGLLTDKYKTPPNLSKKEAKAFFYKLNEQGTWEKAQDCLQVLANNNMQKNITQAAIKWTTNNVAINSVLVGARNRKQLLDFFASG